METGLRIVAHGDGTPSFQIALAEGPVAGDEVVEDDGARVFLEPAAAAVLDGKSLDAQVNEQGPSGLQRLRSGGLLEGPCFGHRAASLSAGSPEG